MELLFWGALASVLYGYLGYPLLLLILSRLRDRPVHAASITPRVTLIVSVHNGRDAIARKIENCLALDYPPALLEVLVASDGSTDGTNELVGGLSDGRVRLVATDHHSGKEVAQRAAIAHAHGDILIFTDAGVQLPPHALRSLVANFADPTVGCVSGVDRVLNEAREAVGEGAFVRYETLLKRLESRAGSIVGNSGWLFAVRHSLCADWPGNMASDFTMLLRTVKRGFRGVADPNAVGYAVATRSNAREFQRKVRTIVRGMVVLASHPEMLNPLRYGFFAIQLLSHKVFRWVLPLLLVFLLASNAVLALHSAIYLTLLLGQLLFYAAGCLVPRVPLARFFVSSNVAVVVAWWKFLSGEHFTIWDPTPRTFGLLR